MLKSICTELLFVNLPNTVWLCVPLPMPEGLTMSKSGAAGADAVLCCVCTDDVHAACLSDECLWTLTRTKLGNGRRVCCTARAPAWTVILASHSAVRLSQTVQAGERAKTNGQEGHYYNCRLLCPRPHREWGNKRCFCPSVCPSICLSVAYIANNSRTQMPSVPKFGRKVPHLWWDSRTSFKVKGQGHQAH